MRVIGTTAPFVLRILGEDLVHACDAVAPQLLESVERGAGVAQSIASGAYERFAPSPLFGDQLGPLEHGDMLVHRSETHWVPSGQCREGLLLGEKRQEHVPTCRIGQGVENGVDALAVSLKIYNHMVIG